MAAIILLCTQFLLLHSFASPLPFSSIPHNLSHFTSFHDALTIHSPRFSLPPQHHSLGDDGSASAETPIQVSSMDENIVAFGELDEVPVSCSDFAGEEDAVIDNGKSIPGEDGEWGVRHEDRVLLRDVLDEGWIDVEEEDTRMVIGDEGEYEWLAIELYGRDAIIEEENMTSMDEESIEGNNGMNEGKEGMGGDDVVILGGEEWGMMMGKGRKLLQAF